MQRRRGRIRCSTGKDLSIVLKSRHKGKDGDGVVSIFGNTLLYEDIIAVETVTASMMTVTTAMTFLLCFFFLLLMKKALSFPTSSSFSTIP